MKTYEDWLENECYEYYKNPKYKHRGTSTNDPELDFETYRYYNVVELEKSLQKFKAECVAANLNPEHACFMLEIEGICDDLSLSVDWSIRTPETVAEKEARLKKLYAQYVENCKQEKDREHTQYLKLKEKYEGIVENNNK